MKDVGLRIVFLEISVAIDNIELTLLKQKGDFMSDTFALLDSIRQLIATDQNELAVRIGSYQDRIAALEASVGATMTPEELAKLKADLNQIHTDMGALAPPLAAPTARRTP